MFVFLKQLTTSQAGFYKYSKNKNHNALRKTSQFIKIRLIKAGLYCGKTNR